MKVEKFDIEKAKAGATVVTTAGRVIKRFVWDLRGADGAMEFAAIVEGSSGAENIWRYRADGRLISDSCGARDKDLYIFVNDEPSEFERKLAELVRDRKIDPSQPVSLAFHATELLEIAYGEELEKQISAAYFKGLNEGREQVRKELPHWRKRRTTGFSSQRFTIQSGDILSDQISGLEIPIEELRNLPISEQQEDYPLARI